MHSRDTGTPAHWPDASAQQRLLAALRPRPRGLFSDVDGTLSPIAPTPEAAVLVPGVRELLDRARSSFDLVAAVSGRSAQDAARLVGLPGLTYIGNHGMERLDSDGTLHILPAAAPYADAIRTALDAVERALAPRYPGLRVERKGVTGSIHLRNAADPLAAEEAVAQMLAQVAEPRGLRVTRGKRVVEVRPPVAVDKGVAIAELVHSCGLRGALYLGDDRTDVDAFQALRTLTHAGVFQGVAVAVLHDEAPPDLAAAADVTLESIERVPALLRWLLEALESSAE